MRVVRPVRNHRGCPQRGLEPAALDTFDDQRVDAGIGGLQCALERPDACTTIIPTSCTRSVNSVGSLAEPNTWRTPAAARTSTMDGSRFHPWIIRFAATGRSVRSEQFLHAIGHDTDPALPILLEPAGAADSGQP